LKSGTIGPMPIVRLPEIALIDAHVHLNGPEALECLRGAGIAAARDAGLRPKARETVWRGSQSAGPVVVTSLWALYKPGGYGSRFGAAVSTAAEIKSEILKLKNAGADIIKVMASGMVSFVKPCSVTPGGFNGDELHMIVDEAGSLGLAVMAHANGEAAIVAAARAGVRSVEHGFFMTERALEALAEKGVFWTPTVGALVRAAEAPEAPAGALLYAGQVVEDHLRMMKQAHLRGITLAVGTDCVLPDVHYKAAYERELLWFEQAGIPRGEVLRIACRDNARLLGFPGV
jgi:imidazolonepropionase-like amidohydrolase